MHRCLLFAVAALLCIAAHANTYTPESIPEWNSTYSYVSNPDGVLSADAAQLIDTLLLSMDRVGVQCLVVAVNSIDQGYSGVEFGTALGNRFGVGGSTNQGLVVLLANESRDYAIVTGDGMEKYVPDVVCGRIERHIMVPYLKREEWDSAMVYTVQALHEIVQGNEEILAQHEQADKEAEEAEARATRIAGIIGLLTIAGIGGAAYRKRRKSRLCPYCKKQALKRGTSQAELVNGEYRNIINYVCSNCGKTVKREALNGVSQGGYYGGGFGRNGGSSGSSGGSFGGFGGGNFSGGGAGGKF